MYGAFVRLNRSAFCCSSTHTLCRHQHTIAKNYYEVLNLCRNCTNREIRDAFAKLSKQYHPDTCKSGNVQQNTKRFQEIIEAYKVLGKNDTRSSYDASSFGNSRSSQKPNNSTQYDPTYHYDFDYEKMRRKTYYNRNNNNRQYYYEWTTHSRPYDRRGSATKQNGFDDFRLTNGQIFGFLWAFVVVNSVIQMCLKSHRARRENEFRMQEDEKYVTRTSYRQPFVQKEPGVE